tara:strand:+ start:172 stop:300 length:129 start_codon:yes stop_codon:yes gene_type:complete
VAGIQPGDTPAFVLAQIFGVLAAAALAAWLFPRVLLTKSDSH